MDPKEFGKRLRLARENAKLAQDDLAELVAKDQRAISEYERGERKLAATDLPTFAKALNVSILYFYEDETNPSDLDQAILFEFHKLPNGMRQGVIQILRALAELSG